jgi:hypothetical protein
MNGTMLPLFGFPTAFDGPTALVTVDTHLLVALVWAAVALAAGIFARALTESRLWRRWRAPRVVLRPRPPKRHAA